MPSPAPLPTLPRGDSTLLLRLLALNEDYLTLAAELAANSHDSPRAIEVAALGDFDAPRNPSVPRPPSPVPTNLLQLYSWSARPEIAAWIAHHHQHQDHFSRRIAITKLESLVKTSPSEVEQRRAATTLLRALDHNWPRTNPSRQANSQSRAAPRISAHLPANPALPPLHERPNPALIQAQNDGLGPRATPSEEGDSPPTHHLTESSRPQSTAAPPPVSRLDPVSRTPSPVSRLPGPTPIQILNAADRLAALLANPSSPLPPADPLDTGGVPMPSLIPSTMHTPATIARAIAHDLQLQDACQAFATIRTLSTDDALEEEIDPLIERIESHIGLPQDAEISEPDHPGTPPGFEDACRIRITHPTRGPILLRFLKEPGAPWLLDLFETG